MNLFEISSPKKAGLIPYIRENNEYYFMFMVPSNSKYGGDQPSIAKGVIDPGENSKQAAIREAQEELGLRKSNIKMDTLQLAWSDSIVGMNETYNMSIYIAEVIDKNKFKTPHFETKETLWLSRAEFLTSGRASQYTIVKTADLLLNSNSYD